MVCAQVLCYTSGLCCCGVCKQMVYLAEDQWTVPPRRVVLEYELAKAYNSGLKHARVHKGVLAHRGERLHCMSAGAVRRTSPPPPPLGTLPAASPTRGLVTNNYLVPSRNPTGCILRLPS